VSCNHRCSSCCGPEFIEHWILCDRTGLDLVRTIKVVFTSEEATAWCEQDSQHVYYKHDGIVNSGHCTNFCRSSMEAAIRNRGD
jgi:hypothetical protein